MASEILMPSLAAGMEQATLVRWLKQEGDPVSQGEVIAEIETDKAVMEMEAQADGSLGRILVPAGSEEVRVGTPIAILLGAGEDASGLASHSAAGQAVRPDATEAPAVPTPEPDPTAPASAQLNEPLTQAPAPAPMRAAAQDDEGERLFASPLARRMAWQQGVDLAGINGSGPHGRIVKLDVERAAAGAPGPVAQPADPVMAPDATSVERIAHSGMRRTIARRLTEAKQQLPHFYLTLDVQMDALLALRTQLNAKAAQATPAYRLSVNDFIVFAVARALRRVPEVNASWGEEAITRYRDVDVCVAVATEAGLITPVIREADRKGLAEIAGEMRVLAEKARAGRLQPKEYQGGGFTISNLGMYGIREFAAIINPPQAAILAVGAVEKRAIVRDDQLAVGSMMTLTLSADHRVVDGAVGARFMAELKSLLEEPLNLLA
ncbi:pyruvate dehydrogenase complex dihydrolipoamide acetyltransferase [Stutzerimonas azotifigens]|uniref:pyruvate dehydrogenase complex dihydrolipoamide acetyltransferase n=1 Tax=Stutzerimonas azotifigens TaxID=291995 RepID=UPI0004096F66|nr:pyruvate dehydrogenase complex dihydrolipoamide acetyltransferase [Stutzerimonas azotifigens]